MRLFQLGATLFSASHAVLAGQPNIIMILSDDQGYSDVSWKNNKVKTPHMDKLRRRGMTLDGAYSQARCTPSRVALLTGKYPWKIGFDGQVVQELAKGGIRLNEKLLPEMMKEQGYKTYGYGKWHVGFCDARMLPQNRGFDHYLGINGPGHHYYEHQLKGTMDYWKDGQKHNSDLYSTDEFTLEAMSVLEDRYETGETDPFFMYMAYNAPHHPYEMPSHALLEEFGNLPTKRKEYLAVLYRMDQMIGRLVDKLEQTGEIDNTYIVFQADNGPTEGGNAYPLRGHKSNYAEGGIRVPAFIMGPGIPADTTMDRNEIIHLTDWIPTFVDMAGGNTNNYKDLDGHSFLEKFLNPSEASPRSEIYHNINTARRGGIYRDGDYKVVFKFYGDYIGRGSPINHTMPDEGPCPFMDNGIDWDMDDIENLGGNLQLSTSTQSTGSDKVVMFNMRNDPYELENVCDDNRSKCDEMVNKIVAISDDYAHIKIIATANANDAATTSDSNFPQKTGWTTSGWCDGDDV